MATNGKWLGNDGQWYDTLIEKNTADNAWSKQREEQHQQNELIAEQNRLLQEQAEREEERRKEQQRFEEERKFNENLERVRQQSHEEEMRILGLFDKIDLNKQYYDDFMKYLISDNVARLSENLNNIKYEKLELDSHLQNVKEVLSDPINKINDNLSSWNEKTKNITKKNIADCYVVDKKRQKLKEKYQEFLNNPMDLPDEYIQQFSDAGDTRKIGDSTIFRSHKDKVRDSQKCYKNNIKWILIWLVLIFLEVLMFMLAMKTDIFIIDILALLGMIIFIPAVIAIVLLCMCMSNDKKDVERILRIQIENVGSDVLDEKKVVGKYNKLRVDYEKQLKKTDKQIINICNEISKEVEPKWNDFVDFRKKHYNSQLEKILLDVGLNKQIKEFGLEYPKINNNNKTGDGTIEDYIAYFDSLTE